MKEWILVLCMGFVTFVPRMLPMSLAGRLKLPVWLKNALDFVPIAVLTAIVVQATFVRDAALDLSVTNYYAITALVAFLAALLTRHLFITIAAGLLCFVVLRLFVGQ